MDAFLTVILTLISLSGHAAPSSIQLNDNLQPGGVQQGPTLTIHLYAGTGVWRPKGPAGDALEVAAFGEEGAGLFVPGPLVRARAGTAVVLSLRNALEAELRVSGLCSRPGPCDPVVIAPGTTREIRFSLDAPGTYYYWASRSAEPLATRPARDTQLSGAIVVDPANGPIDDRIMLITVYQDDGRCAAVGKRGVFAINGASWPYTRRLHYNVGETARWRVINLSCEAHAMHLHGFHFTVLAAGDGLVDRSLAEADRRTAVTERLPGGGTFSLAWTPMRAGNWLFHCHMVIHMAAPMAEAHASPDSMTQDAGMAGLVMGVEVAGPRATLPAASASTRRLTMVVSEDQDRYGKGLSGYRVDFEGIDAPRLSTGPLPGPILILRRGEPTEITVVNRTTQPTAIHWHGIEIESYFDGVPGFGGHAGQLAPSIAPGQSFIAKMTPPRAGTFIYHTHWHDEAQLTGGLYGPLLVLEPGEQYDPAVDHILMIGLNGREVTGARLPAALNGSANPAPMQLRAGVPNRLRLINITANNVSLTASLVRQFDPLQWRILAKDGFPVSAEQSTPRQARQVVTVGETYDVEITPPRPEVLWFDFRTGAGLWLVQMRMDVR